MSLSEDIIHVSQSIDSNFAIELLALAVTMSADFMTLAASHRLKALPLPVSSIQVQICCVS